jgi:hypothetical protein
LPSHFLNAQRTNLGWVDSRKSQKVIGALEQNINSFLFFLSVFWEHSRFSSGGRIGFKHYNAA